MSRAVTYLLIDNSNTRTKFVLSSVDALSDQRVIIPTREINAERLDRELSGLQYDFTVVSSVVPRVSELLEEWLTSPYHVVSHTSQIGLGIDYPHPKMLGADRLANAAGVVASYGAPAIVVDFGTAVTFDVIGANQAYQGGVIAPGLASMGDYLSRNTALLPAIDPQEPKYAIGRTTEEAMHAGAVYGYRGLVKEILIRLETEMQCHPVVVSTGGDAPLISHGVPRIDHVDRDLTLTGLRVIANLNLR
ncbi:MAG: type III pantothenate kinase [Akkermansia sp.]